MITIEEYVCNLIAGNYHISTLYFAVDRARDIENKDNRFQMFQKKISFQGIGTKVYKSSQLVNIENLSFCYSYQTLINLISQNENNKPTLDQYIILLLKARNTIRGLYQACCRAKILRENAKVFCYTFVNPFPNSLVSLNRNRLSYKSAFNFISFFCQCERKQFNPQLVFPELYNL